MVELYLTIGPVRWTCHPDACLMPLYMHATISRGIHETVHLPLRRTNNRTKPNNTQSSQAVSRLSTNQANFV